MTYTPTECQSGDIVTSAKLNKLENGVAGAVFPVRFTIDIDAAQASFDKTYAEITEALAAGVPLFVTGADTSGSGTIYGVTFVIWEPGPTPDAGYITFWGIPTVNGDGVSNTGITLHADDSTTLLATAYPE